MKKNIFVVRLYARKIYPSGLNDFHAIDANVMLFFLNEDENNRQLKQYETESPEESLRKIQEFLTSKKS